MTHEILQLRGIEPFSMPKCSAEGPALERELKTFGRGMQMRPSAVGSLCRVRDQDPVDHHNAQ